MYDVVVCHIIKVGLGSRCYSSVTINGKGLVCVGEGASAMINQEPLSPRLVGLQTPH